MKRNDVSLYVPPHPSGGINKIMMQTANMRITGDNTSLLLPYLDQAPTIPSGAKPYAGMVLNDFEGNIGINRQDANVFTELNNGIITINSTLLVQNCSFKSIKNYDGYTMPLNALNGTGIFAGAHRSNCASLNL